MSEWLTPLIVDSSGRSGTTMMMGLLASSREIAMDRQHPYEHVYFTWMAEWSAIADRTTWDYDRWDIFKLAMVQGEERTDSLVGPPPFLPRQLWQGEGEGDEIGPLLLTGAWREFSARAVHRTRRDLAAPDTAVRYHAEKALSVARLRDISPFEVRGIVLHRDPRDIWLSVQAFDLARGFFGFGRTPEESEGEWFERFLALHARRLRACLAERDRADSLLVAYEEMVLRPDETADRLGRWLGVALDPSAPDRDLERNRHHSTSSTPEESVARWKRELEPWCRERFLQEMGTELVELGYDA